MRLAPLAADTTKPRNPPEAPPRDPWSIKKRDVPYVPTDDQVVRGMLKLANVSPSDLLYDLGCGDGRIVIAAARRCGASAVGVDIDHQRLAECTENARRASHGNATRLPDGTTLWHILPEHSHRGTATPTVRFLEQSLFDLDFSPATVVMLYLLPRINQQLIPTFLQLRPGTRIVSNTFPMGYEPPLWQPDETLTLHQRTLMKWIVPAPLAGTWHGIARLPNHSRARLELHLSQHYQTLSGTALLPLPPHHRRHLFPLGNPLVHGPHFTCHLPTGPTSRPLDLSLTFTPHTLRGTWHDGISTGPVYFIQR